MNSSSRPAEFPDRFQAFKKVLDRYMADRLQKVESLLHSRLGLEESFQIQKKSLWLDLILNTINALWAIPYLVIRKLMEVADKLGWEQGRLIFLKVPPSFPTGFQKQVETMIATEIFSLSPTAGNTVSLSREWGIDPALEATLTPEEKRKLFIGSEALIRQAIVEFCQKQNSITDLISSGGMVIIAQMAFGDRSLDLFGIGRRIASLWAKSEAESKFIFGRSLGKAFYSIAPPPPPTTGQVFLTTLVVLLALSLLSTAVGILSHPLQKKMGLRQKQMDNLVNVIGERLLVHFSKTIPQ